MRPGRQPAARRAWRGYPLLLAALLVVVAVSSTWCVVTDRRPLIHDPLSNLVSAMALKDAVASGSSADWRRWLQATWYRPPLPALLYQPALMLADDPVDAMRLTDVALLLVLLWVVYRMGARLSSPRAGLLAALLTAGFPLVQGWGRMGNADPVIWLSLALVMWVLLWLDLRSPWQATALGLCVGLCLATRLLCLALLVGPGLWVLAFHLRGRRGLINLLAAGIWALAVAGWWYAAQHQEVYYNLVMSSADPAVQERTLAIYLRTGYGWVVGGAAVAGALALARGWISRQRLALMALWIGAPWLQFVLLWHIWERYPLATVPQCALLVALAEDRLTLAWPAWRRRVAGVGLAALGLLPLTLYYTVEGMDQLSSGLMWPDPRPHRALTRALAAAPAAEPVLVLHELSELSYGWGALWRARLPHPLRTLYSKSPTRGPGLLSPMTRNGRVRHLLRVAPLCRGEGGTMCEYFMAHAWWDRARARLPLTSVALSHDPDGIEYELFRLPRPMTGEQLARYW